MMRRVLLSWILLTVCVLAGAQTARWSIKPIYSSIEPMDENIMKVKVGGKVGAITRSGKVLVEPVADSLTAFVEGKALALASFTGAGKEEYYLMGILGQDESVKRPSQTEQRTSGLSRRVSNRETVDSGQYSRRTPYCAGNGGEFEPLRTFL